MTEHTRPNTGRTDNRNRHTDDAFGPAVTPPRRPRSLAAHGVGESAEFGGESTVLGEGKGHAATEHTRTGAAETPSTVDRDTAETAGGRTSQFILGRERR